MTLEQIVEETRHWPPEKLGELVDRLAGGLHAGDPAAEAAWRTEIDRRVEGIRSGNVEGVPAEHVFEQARRLLRR